MSSRVAVRSATLETRYWSHVDRRGADECWPWTAYRQKHGHGSIWVGYDAQGTVVMDGAHRVAWELAHGQSPGEMHVRHRCDNPPCQNPAHLELGTHLDNMQDMVDRERYKVVVGSKHGKAKLTEQDVRDIRALHRGGHNQCEIGRMFGVSNQNIGFIVKRITWRHVEDVA